MMYKISRYIHLFTSTKGVFLLYNSRTNSFFQIKEKLYNRLHECKKDSSMISDLKPETYNFLVEKKVIVHEYEDDQYVSKLQHESEKSIFAKKRILLVVVPTLDCNFDCAYCFEEGKQSLKMNNKTIDALIEFIKNHKYSEKIDLLWYGGEPLLEVDIIKNILEKITKETQLELASHRLVTNGYFFNEDVISLFEEYPLNSIQITLDGCKERHDKIRKDKLNGNPSYEKIINNIDQILNKLPGTHVSIRVNIEKENKQDYNFVSEELGKRWAGKNIYIYPGFIRKLNEKQTEFSCESFQPGEIAEFMYDLNFQGKSDSIYPKPNPRKICSANKANSYIVGPLGEIYKCWNDVSNKDKVVGNIHSNKFRNKTLYYGYLSGTQWFNSIACKKCFYLPICNANCAWFVLKNKYEKGKFNICDPLKSNPQMLDKALEAYYEDQCKKIKV